MIDKKDLENKRIFVVNTSTHLKVNGLPPKGRRSLKVNAQGVPLDPFWSRLTKKGRGTKILQVETLAETKKPKSKKTKRNESNG